MLQQFTISNEVISVDVSRELGKLIQAQVAEMRKSCKETGIINAGALKKLGEIVGMTGINITFETSPYIDAWMFSPSYPGHQGTAWTSGNYRIVVSSKDGLRRVAKVDLVKLQVTGSLVDEIKFTSCIGSGFFEEGVGFTDEEITAAILHEIGHAFNIFVTLSDYIWLNYMLSDGVDVLMGNKRNEYNLEVLDHTWVEKNIAKELREDYVNKRTPAQARRAILSTYKKAPRHYLFANNGSAHKREEQMADLFATRLGYGRPLVTALHRMNKLFGYDPDQRTTIAGGLVRMALSIALLPFVLLWLMVCSGTNDLAFSDRYDNPKERHTKIRLDLINQLKTIKNRRLIADITSDIDAVDLIIKEYHNDTTMFDAMAEFASPILRREKRLIKHEENLETLLNNDLFVAANRYNS